MKIAIIGSDGQLGSDLVMSLRDHALIELTYPRFDVTRSEETREKLCELIPDAVINTAAYHRVDECEENPSKSFAVNSVAVRDLALTCKALKATLIHFSTDYVFDGKKTSPYTEDDPPAPLNVYGVTKLAGEYFVRNIMEKYFLIRTCGLYGSAGCWGKGTNFVDAIVSQEKEGRPIRVVNDQWITPTSTAELADRIRELIETQHYGLYHLTNEGQCTWFEFADMIFTHLGKEPALVAVNSEEYGAKAKRPRYSVLENARAKNIGLSEFSHWKDALKDYLSKKGYMPSP